MIPSENSNTPVTSYATMESDVHVEGNVPSNMTNGKSFLSISRSTVRVRQLLGGSEDPESWVARYAMDDQPPRT